MCTLVSTDNVLEIDQERAEQLYIAIVVLAKDFQQLPGRHTGECGGTRGYCTRIAVGRGLWRGFCCGFLRLSSSNAPVGSKPT
jgi:hypothetical protein